MTQPTEATTEPVDETRYKRDAALRKLCRQIAASIVRGMAYRDMSFEQMAERFSTTLEPSSAKFLRYSLNRLIAGKPVPLRVISDMFLAMDMEVEFTVRDIAPRAGEPPA